MEAHLLDWLNLLIRWAHVIVGIAWIGASFYFVMLDTSLTPPVKQIDIKRGVHGELWAVHGGGFYNSQKYLLGPQGEPLSDNLHWSKWEAYTTWLTGMTLLVLIYWAGADVYLIDKSVMVLTQFQAISISVAILVAGWFGYNGLCGLRISDKALVFILLGLLSVVAFGLCHIYSGRGAYMMFGALLGTIMVANVAHIIIPGQRKMVDAIRANKEVDPIYGQLGKQRSMHNTYFTLPVIFVMTSNHYAMTYNHAYNWLWLILISLAGALIRVFFVSRHGQGKPNYLVAIVGLALLALVIIFTAPNSTKEKTIQTNVTLNQASHIIQNRCTVCHSRSPIQPGFASAPKGIVFDTQAQISAQASLIYQQVVITRAMPIGNLTSMTEEERSMINSWYQHHEHH